MSGVINRGNYAQLLRPGINSIYGQDYKQWDTQYDKLFDVRDSTLNFEEDLFDTGFGLLQEKDESGSIVYDSARQGFTNRYIHKTHALGFVISREMMEDETYGKFVPSKTHALARSLKQSVEIDAANVYNRATNSSYTGGDGVTLLNSAHVNVNGGTWSNMPTNHVDISEAALEQAYIDIAKFKDDRGLYIHANTNSLIVPVDSKWVVDRIMKSKGRIETSNNDMNAIGAANIFPGGIHTNRYLTDIDAWYIRTDVMDGMKFYWRRRGDTVETDNEFDTENAKFKLSARWSNGWTDPRGLFGSTGA